MSKLTFEAMENMCAKEPMSGCWIWEKRTNAGGYGMARAGELAHRVCYELAGNEIPKGLDLMHLCHNRLCINPAHLRPGTRKENVMMSVNANRWNLALRSEKQKANRAKLSRNGFLYGLNARFTEIQVKGIRKLAEFGISKSEIGKSLNVTRQCINAICKRKAYRYVL